MPAILRRSLLVALLLMALPAQAFDLGDVAKKAATLAEKPYEKPDVKLPPTLANLNYDQYRDIRFRPDHAIWRGTKLPFEIQLLHPGRYYDRAIRLNLVTADGVKPLRYDARDFDYGKNKIDVDELKDLGFAGFRVHYPLNSDAYKDELIVFQGASYFRALGKGQRYGLSARGLAVDTGELTGEEFPSFTEFWIEWPRAEDHQLTIYALLDSQRMTGAYRFKVRPGDDTRIDVSCKLFFRSQVNKIGIGALTSMYMYGENQPAPVEDYRPEVHDSDGLLVHTEQEWVWRPLVNPRRLLITSFGTTNPRGFGLLQRDRNFGHYEDLEARYETRPSAWVEPKGEWGKGRVELVMIPTPDETNDNIVAYWVPERAPQAGDSVSFDYDLYWQLNPDRHPDLAHVEQTRRGHGWVKEADDTLRFHVDFAGGPLKDLPADAKVVPGVWIGDGGELLERQAYRNDVTGGWRLSLRIRRTDESKPLEMRAVLTDGERNISETWAYVLPAASTARRLGDL